MIMHDVGAKAGRAGRYIFAETSLRMPRRRANGICDEVVVSLTTFPARIDSLWKTLESLYGQSVAPGKIILNLSADEFPHKEMPSSLNKYLALGLEVDFSEGNMRSYKKLIPAVLAHPARTIVTADDDVVYPRRWLEKLVAAHRSAPSAIIGHRGTEIIFSGNAPAPYVDWPAARKQTPAERTFLTGMGGILYPPGSMPEMVTDVALAQELCPTADDIWFKAMSLLAKTTVIRILTERGDKFVTVREAQKSALRSVNVTQSANDKQFARVMDHFGLWGALRRS
jgi:hypothetical protein